MHLTIFEIFHGADIEINQPSNTMIKDPVTMELYSQESFSRNFEELSTDSLSLANFAKKINITSPKLWAHYAKRTPLDIITVLMLPTLSRSWSYHFRYTLPCQQSISINFIATGLYPTN